MDQPSSKSPFRNSPRPGRFQKNLDPGPTSGKTPPTVIRQGRKEAGTHPATRAPRATRVSATHPGIASTDADRPQPAQDQQEDPTLETFTEGLRHLEAMANRPGIRAVSTGHRCWPGTWAARGKFHDLPTGPHTKLTLRFNTGDRLIPDRVSSSARRIG